MCPPKAARPRRLTCMGATPVMLSLVVGVRMDLQESHPLHASKCWPHEDMPVLGVRGNDRCAAAITFVDRHLCAVGAMTSSLDITCLQNWAALHLAAKEGHAAVVRFLVVERSANVDATINMVRG